MRPLCVPPSVEIGRKLLIKRELPGKITSYRLWEEIIENRIFLSHSSSGRHWPLEEEMRQSLHFLDSCVYWNAASRTVLCVCDAGRSAGYFGLLVKVIERNLGKRSRSTPASMPGGARTSRIVDRRPRHDPS